MKIEPFPSSYPEARAAFLEAARNAGAWHRTLPHPQFPGLFIDVVRQSPAKAGNVLIINSGTHGIEGYVGSAIQTMALKTGLLEDRSVAAVLVHGINPWGFHFGSRTNEDNIDLNRNFIDWNAPRPAEHRLTEKANSLLLPKKWSWPNWRLTAFMLLNKKNRQAQAAVSQGQYRFKQGLFYGGAAAAWSNHAWRETLAQETAGAENIVHVDIHSGLGPRGHGELIVHATKASAEFRRATAMWDERTIRSPVDGNSASTMISGDILAASAAIVGPEKYTGAALEFGTLPIPKVLEALALDNWLRAKGGDAPKALFAEKERKIRDAFAPRDPEWEAQVSARGHEVLQQAMTALRRPKP